LGYPVFLFSSPNSRHYSPTFFVSCIVFPPFVHRYIYIFGLVAMAFGIMMGAIPSSVPMFLLGINWLLEGRFAEKWKTIKEQPALWVVVSPFLLHTIGLAWTTDWQVGMTDFRVRIPMLAVPLIMFTTPALTIKETKTVLWFFIGGCLVSTAWCLYYSLQLHPEISLREASRFMSHIRLGMFLAMCLFVLGWLFLQAEKVWISITSVLIFVYILLVMVTMALFSGMFIFMAVLSIWSCYQLLRSQSWTLKIFGCLLPLVIIAIPFAFLKQMHDAQLVPVDHENNRVKNYTMAGNWYAMSDTTGQMENGFYVLRNIQPGELTRGWNAEHPDDLIDLANVKKAKRFGVLIRYLASKGLCKDSVGYLALTKEDKENIAQAIPNYKWPHWNAMQQRAYELINEYDEFIHHRRVNGHSVSMRLYYWKAGLTVFSNNWLFGVGSGDVQQEMVRVFVSENYPLEKEWFKRPHNQFINEAAALGGVGLIAFIALILVPFWQWRKSALVLYGLWLTSVVFSFLFEDTLETQAGVAYFTFFQGLFANTKKR